MCNITKNKTQKKPYPPPSHPMKSSHTSNSPLKQRASMNMSMSTSAFNQTSYSNLNNNSNTHFTN